jgi:hypothetical protein
MANGICDVCKTRPAAFRAQVLVNGERQTLELCDADYRKLARSQGRSSSPLESLFGGILRLPQNPKFFMFYDPEVVGDLVPEGFPLVRDGFAKEL